MHAAIVWQLSMREGNKKFLNDSLDETGYICWHITNEKKWCKEPLDLHVNLKFADCEKSARFDFNVYGDITVDDRVKKNRCNDQ